jgi:hypothetical protein
MSDRFLSQKLVISIVINLYTVSHFKFVDGAPVSTTIL